MKQKRTGKNKADKSSFRRKKFIWIPVFLLFISLVPAAKAFHSITSRSHIISDYPVYPVIDFDSEKQPEAVKRGEYLVKVGDCIACHTDSGSKNKGPRPLLGFYDLYFSCGNLRRSYPVEAYFRSMLEYIRPEIHPYFITNNMGERPFHREQRDLVYRRACNLPDTLPFGIELDILEDG